jgi:hypothetical protein
VTHRGPTPLGRCARLALLASALVVAPGVAQKLEIETHKDPAADFTAIRTYGWLPPAPIIRNVAPGSVTNPTLSQEALGPPIVAAVDRELAARGLTRVDGEGADAHVTYFAALTVGFSQTYVGEYYGYVTGWASPIAPGLAPSTSMTVYEKGTVLIDMVNGARARAIWRGTVRTRVHQEHSLEKRIERINDATARLFRQFPIRPVKK